MRVSKLLIENHPGIGSVEIDFRDASGKAARLVVMAGENGTGKTTIINAIFRSLTGIMNFNSDPNIKLRVLVEDNIDRNADIFRRWENYKIDEEGIFNLSQVDRSDIRNTEGLLLGLDRPIILPDGIQISEDISQYFGSNVPCFLSRSEVTFHVPSVDQFRPQIEESLQRPVTETDGELGTRIASMLVSLKGADDAELAKWVEDNPGGVPPAEVFQRRIKRFREAFALVMPNKRFKGVELRNSYYHPVFEEDGRTTALTELSTGEKQVVLRGAFLLQQTRWLRNSVILIDEPELGLHPAWQSKILDFYDKIIGNDVDASNQIILCTHSPFVVHGSPAAKHIILKRNRQAGRIEVDPTSSFPGVTPGDRAIAAFDLADFNFGKQGNRLAIVTEGPTDAKILKTAWEKLRPSSRPTFDVLPARGAASIPSLLGSAEGVPGPLADAAAPLGIDRFIGLFDFDHEGFAQWNGMALKKRSDDECLNEAQCSRRRRKGCLIWSALLPVPPHRPKYASHRLGSRSILAIELLFPDEHVRSMLTEVEIAGADQPILSAADSQKSPIAEACSSFPTEAFDAFKPIFELVDHVLAYREP